MNKSETVPISWRVPLELKNRIHEMATAKNVNLSQFFTQLLVNEIKKEEQAVEIEERHKVAQKVYEKDLATLKERFSKHSNENIIKAALQCANANEQSLLFMENIGAYLPNH